jgi:serine/threonine-protein kinase
LRGALPSCDPRARSDVTFNSDEVKVSISHGMPCLPNAEQRRRAIKVYDFGQTNTGELYIAMELLTGRSLEKVLEQDGALVPERADKILGQICGSLQEAHEKGIVHRDLKPANIQLLTRAGEDDYVKVLDFGIAKKNEPASKQDQKLTRQGTILGTPPYMSPEQFKGGELDARSDIYSLGVMAYEMLSGRLPFEADTPWQWATQHMTAQPFPFETIPMAANVPPKMKTAVMRALSKDREKRQQTVKEFYEESTLGAVRMSMLGMAPRTSSDLPQSGTTAMPARPGGTQVGAPLFVEGAPNAPAGGTLIDSTGSMPTPPTAGAGSVPTGGGQVMAAPPPPAKKGISGALIGGIGGAVLLGVIVVIVVTRRPSGGDTGTPTIPLPSASTTATVSSDPPPQVASAAPDAGPHPANSVPTSHVTGPAEAACDEAVKLAGGGNVQGAVTKYRECNGPGKSRAADAIGMAAQSHVSARKCGAKADALAAASIGRTAARDSLPANCRN